MFQNISRILAISQNFARIRNVTIQAIRVTIPRKYTTANPSVDFSCKEWINLVNTKCASEIPITANNVNELLEVIEKNSVSSKIAFDILETCSSVRFDKVEFDVISEVWERFLKSNVELQYAHFDIVLSHYSANGNTTAARRIYDDFMKDIPHFQNGIIRAKLFDAYCKAGSSTVALEFIKEFEKDNLLTEAMVNKLIECCVRNGDVAGGDYAWNLLNDKEFYINSTSLIAVLEFFINKNDLENVINTLLKMHENGFEHLNRHVLKAILKLSTAKSIDPLVLLQYLQPNDEFEKAIADAIPAFVKCSKAELMPHIFEAIPLNRESNTKYLFIEMVCRSRPADEFMNVWNSLEKHGFDIKTHLAAYKPALNGQLYALIQEILKHMQSDPTEKLYDSAFKRLLELAAENSGDHLMEAIKLMCSTYKIRPRSQFIDSTIIPLLMKQSNFSDALVKLRYIDNIPVNYIGEACIKAALSENDIHKAYDIASSNSGALQNTNILQGLQKAYLTTHDTDEFVRFLRLIFDNIIGRNLNSKRIQLGGSHDKDDKLIENIIQSTIVAQKVDSEQNNTLLNALSREGFTISDKCNKSIVRVLKVKGKSDIGKLLTELMASNRTLRPISSALAQYVQEKNTAAIDNLLADNNIHICTAEYALLIDYYCWQQNLERILNLLESAREADHHFKLDFMKALQIINLMIKEKRIDSNLIRALLEENTIVVHYERFDMLYAVLSKLSIDGNDELVKCITHFAVKNNCVQRTNKLFGPTVAVHLRKNDFKGAVNAFERVANEFGMAPMTIILYKTLIQNNENDLLDNAHHIYLNLYGEKAALIQLALAYAESGQHEKANEIFRHKSMPNVRTMISKYCFTFSKFNQVNALEGLLHSTKGLDCNRHDIYAGLLDIYCTQKLVDKVVSLKQLSIEEGVTLSPTCTKKMSHFLQSNGAES